MPLRYILVGLKFVLLWLIVISGQRVMAEERIALLVGNQAYKESVGALRNPHNDVALIAGTLDRLGFKVTIIKDAGYKSIDTAFKTHIQKVRRAGKDTISFFYYSGHGASDPETRINYLIPIDVESADDANLWTNSFELNDIVSKLREQAPEATHYVVFDACRDELRLTRQGNKALGAEKGFTPVGTVTGVMIAYATAPGRTASDVGQRAGPYATALAEEMSKPGVEAVTMFRNVQLKVKRTIGQDPWLSFPTLPPVYLAGKETAEEIEFAFWQSVKDSRTPEEISTYLAHYPDGQFAPLARALIAHFEQQARAEKARLIEKQREEEETRRTAELQRLAEEQRARELEVAGRRREAEKKANAEAVRQFESQREAEALVYAEKMRKALEEVRVAREMAKAAEEQRLAAVQAAAEATRAAEAAAKQAGQGDKIVIAALPKLDLSQQNFDGNWTFQNSSQTCKVKSGSVKVAIRGTTIRVFRRDGEITGQIDSSGAIRWITAAKTDGAPVDWSGRLQGNSGSGTYVRRDRKCSGIFTARRD
jgi:caspase domain-containing protein